MIYLDNSATTQTRPQVAKVIAEYSVDNFFNPSSIYAPAIKVKLDIDGARQRFLTMLGANQEDRIIFTGSATEANNLVLNGLAKKNKKILVSAGEHPSVFQTAQFLKAQGYMVDFVNLKADGTVDTDDLLAKLDTQVGLVSIMHISNETGAINDIGAINKIIKTKAPQCLFHVDGVQAFGKVRVYVAKYNIDAYTISAHKIHGPKGVACLYLRKGINIKPHLLGGGQEGGTRSGTENPAGIMGFVLAGEMMYQDFEAKRQHIRQLKEYLLDKLSQTGLEYQLNSPLGTLDNICSVAFYGVRGEVLLHCLEKYDIFVSTGSACSSKSVGNRVLSAMGQQNNQMQGNIRISMSEFTTQSDIDVLIQALQVEVPLIKH